MLYIGIDGGGTKTKMALFDDAGRKLKEIMRYCSSKTQTIPVLILQNYTTRSTLTPHRCVSNQQRHTISLWANRNAVFLKPH